MRVGVVSGEGLLDLRPSDRGGLLDGEAASRLVSGAGAGSGVRRAVLSGWTLTAESGAVLGSALGALDGLVALDMSNVLVGISELEGRKALQALCAGLAGVEGDKTSALEEVDVSDNAIQADMVTEALWPVLTRSPNLKVVKFQNCGISGEAAGVIRDALREGGVSLREAWFYNNMSGDQGAIAIADLVRHSPHLQILRVSTMRVGEEGGKALCDAVEHLAHLRRIDFTDNMFLPSFGENFAIAIAKPSSCATSIQTLLLNDLNLEDEGVEAFAKTVLQISQKQTTEEEEKGAGEGGGGGGEKSSSSSSSSPSSSSSGCFLGGLEELGLCANEVLEDGGGVLGVEALVGLLPRLHRLYLADNELEHIGAAVIARAIATRAARRLPPLHTLDLTRCLLSGKGAKEIAIAFANAHKSTHHTTHDKTEEKHSEEGTSGSGEGGGGGGESGGGEGGEGEGVVADTTTSSSSSSTSSSSPSSSPSRPTLLLDGNFIREETQAEVRKVLEEAGCVLGSMEEVDAEADEDPETPLSLPDPWSLPPPPSTTITTTTTTTSSSTSVDDITAALESVEIKE